MTTPNPWPNPTPYFCASKYRYYIWDSLEGKMYKTNDGKVATEAANVQEDIVIDLELGVVLTPLYSHDSEDIEIVPVPIEEYHVQDPEPA